MSQEDTTYLTSTRVLDIFEHALADILEKRPENPISYIIDYFQRESASSSTTPSTQNTEDIETLLVENRKLRECLEDAKRELQQMHNTISLLRSPTEEKSFDPHNPILSVVLDTDSYKLSHWKQYPPGTTSMFSYFESRGGKFTHSVFFGLQYYLKRYLTRPITRRDVDEAAAFAARHGLPFNAQGWMRIVEHHQGRLPIRIRAVPEGLVVPVKNALLTVESTDPECFWVVSWLETLLVRLWCPITVATNSMELRRLIETYHAATSDKDPRESAEFSMHDFGARGVSSQETAMIAGAAHLTSFKGSDTIAGVWMANHYYHSDMAGFSIPASEHSTICMWGPGGEPAAFENMIGAYGDTPMFACVSDSFDVFHAVDKIWGETLRDKVIKMPARLVVRPDSGDPVNVCVRVAESLADKFGFQTNSKGYKEIQHVSIIQGDGVDYDTVGRVLQAFKERNFSATNISFGSGGALLQKFHRDTMKFAFKCSSARIDGQDVEVFKAPTTDPGKTSKRGRLDLIRTPNGEFQTVPLPEGVVSLPHSVMETVFEDGVILKVPAPSPTHTRLRPWMKSGRESRKAAQPWALCHCNSIAVMLEFTDN